MIVLVVLGIIVVIVDAFALIEGQSVVLVEVVYDEIVCVVLEVDGKYVVLVVESGDEVANAVKIEDRNVFVLFVVVCVVDMINLINLVEVGIVDWVVGLFVVVKGLSVVLIEVFIDVDVVECGRIVSIEFLSIVDFVVGLAMVEKG